MKGAIILKTFTVLFFITTIPILTKAEKGKPGNNIHISFDIISSIESDTLPPVTKNTENKSEKPVIETIKEVPKARRQSVPVPVVKVKPVKVIKPKIIPPKIIKPKIIKPLIKGIN